MRTSFYIFVAFVLIGCNPPPPAVGCLGEVECQTGFACDKDSGQCLLVNVGDAGIPADAPIIVVDANGIDAASPDVVICVDGDGDGFGDGCANGDDCDDTNDQVHTLADAYVDSDGDGVSVGDQISICAGVELPNGFVAARSNDDDCDDGDASVSIRLDVFVDADKDGATAGSAVLCTDGTLPVGFLAAESAEPDCNDNNDQQFPGNAEVCDALDNDCDGVADFGTVCSDACVVGYRIAGGGIVGVLDQPNADYLHPYLFCDGVTRSWVAARVLCQSAGYDILVLETVDENLDIGLALLGGNWWVGLSDRQTEGAFRWIEPGGVENGPPLSYDDFLNGEPNNSGNEDCVEYRMFPGAPVGEGWNDTECNENRFVACEAIVP